MRIPSPPSLKLSREALLQEAAQILTVRAPELKHVIDDPADPGWLLLEQAAWMVERLSEQLEASPRQQLQQLLHLAGHQLLPALPALGVLAVDSTFSGPLTLFNLDHHPVRFFAASAEVEVPLEFVPLEAGPISMTVGSWIGLYRWEAEGAFSRLSKLYETPFPHALVRWRETLEPMEAFQLEDIHFTFPISMKERLLILMQRYNGEGRAWMHLGLDGRENAAELGVRWRLSLDQVQTDYAESEDSGVQSLSFSWKELPLYPLHPDQPGAYDYRPLLKLRGEAQQLGARLVLTASGQARVEIDRSGSWLRKRKLSELVAIARPVPALIAEQFYQTLLLTLAEWKDKPGPTLEPSRTAIFRQLPKADPASSPWLSAALQNPRLETLLDQRTAEFFHLELSEGPSLTRMGMSTPARQRVRFGLLVSAHAHEKALPLHMFGVLPLGGQRLALQELRPDEGAVVAEQWRFPWPVMTASEGMDPDHLLNEAVELRVFEVSFPSSLKLKGLLGVFFPEALGLPAIRLHATVLNPLLVGNMPIVYDGRSVRATSALPEPTSLLWKDLLTREVLDRLQHTSLPASLQEQLRRIPLADLRLQRPEGAELLHPSRNGFDPFHPGEEGIQTATLDWRGLQVDPTEGIVVLNAPDVRGERLPLRRGDRLQMAWYRRTDGERGNVRAGRVTILEQSSSTPTPLRRVYNPLPMLFGRSAERVEQGMERLFSAPVRPLPATAGEFEQWAAQELAELLPRCTLRCWGEAERSLLACDWWLGSELEQSWTREAALLLERHGPRALLLVVGLPRARPAGVDFVRVRQRLQRGWERLMPRLPTLEVLAVAPFIPLIHETRGGKTVYATTDAPCFELKGLEGWLQDGNRARPLRGDIWFYLNAAIVASRSV